MRPTQLTAKCTIRLRSIGRSSTENVLSDDANLTKVKQMVKCNMEYEKWKYLPPHLLLLSAFNYYEY